MAKEKRGMVAGAAGSRAGHRPGFLRSLSDEKTKQWLAALLVLLSIVPVWLVAYAPLVDWATHLAVSRVIYQLLSGQAANAHYHLDFGFLGYSFVHLLLAGLQAFVSTELAGKLVLTTFFIVNPLCWWLAFKILAPERQELALLGVLLNFTTFFFDGGISFMFSIPFGLLWLALGLDALLNGRRRVAAFAVLGALTYLSHVYVFVLLGMLMGAAGALQVLARQRKCDGWTLVLLALMGALALVSVLGNRSVPRDLGMMNAAGTCALGQAALPVPAVYDAKEFRPEMTKTMLQWAYGFVVGWETIFPLQFLLPVVLAAGAVAAGLLLLGAWRRWQGARWEQVLQPARAFWPEVADMRYLLIAGYFLVAYLLAPSDCVDYICALNGRALPFLGAFLLLGLHLPRVKIPVFWIGAVVIVVCIFAQAWIFLQAAPAQARVLEQMKQATAGLPAGASVFVVPSKQTSIFGDFLNAPFPNQYEEALLVLDHPTAYVSGLYTSHDVYVLRSDWAVFDEEAHFGPNPYLLQTNRYDCYRNISSQYQYVLDENLTLRPNPNARVSP